MYMCRYIIRMHVHPYCKRANTYVTTMEEEGLLVGYLYNVSQCVVLLPIGDQH